MPQIRDITAVADTIKFLSLVITVRLDIGIIGTSGNLHFIIQEESGFRVLALPGFRVCPTFTPSDIPVVQRAVPYAEQGITHRHVESMADNSFHRATGNKQRACVEILVTTQVGMPYSYYDETIAA